MKMDRGKESKGSYGGKENQRESKKKRKSWGMMKEGFGLNKKGAADGRAEELRKRLREKNRAKGRPLISVC